MSEQENAPVDEPAVQAALALHVAQQAEAVGAPLPALSLRHINTPCKKHAADPPGAQVMNDDGTRKRDPNGFTWGCPDCLAEIRVEG